jgi:murein DD-endopeptidase MepM/ murein hydrolase activator NlpD
MKNKWILLGTTALLSMLWSGAVAQGGEFKALVSPVKHKVLLNGTFAELRGRHFHGGVDFKSSSGWVGDSLFATHKGYVEEITRKGSGYGNLVAIRHLNGDLSLYAHLDRFRADLEEYLFKEQRKEKKSEITLQLPPNLFPVEAGDLIGYMGNTGHSFGPHLHYEYRTSEGSKVNPLLLGFDLYDSKAPGFLAVELHALDKEGSIVGRKNLPYSYGGGKYGDTVFLNWPTWGLAFDAIDQMEGSAGKNGIYGYKVFVNDSLIRHFEFDRLTEKANQFFPAYIDYEKKITKGRTLHCAYALENRDLLKPQSKGRGIWRLAPGQIANLRLEIYDFQKNTRAMHYVLKGHHQWLTPEIREYNYKLPYHEGGRVELAGATFLYEPNTFHTHAYLLIDFRIERSPGLRSLVYSWQPETTPLLKDMDIMIYAPEVTPAEKTKAYVSLCTGGKSYKGLGGEWRGDTLVAKTQVLGQFSVQLDTIPPSLRLLSWPKNIGQKGSIVKWRVTDNKEHSKGMTFDAWVGDEWFPLVYDKKQNLLSFQFPQGYERGKSTVFRLRVTDALGNEAHFKRTF